MTWGYWNRLLLLVSLTLIHPSEENCNEYFEYKSWFSLESPPEPVALIRTNNSMDIMECSLERLCLKQQSECPSLERMCKRKVPKVCFILRHCFKKPPVSKISEKCEGENYTSIQMLHFMCWVAKAAPIKIKITPDYCDDYGSLCQTYSEMSFPPKTGQTTLPPTTNATTPRESTTVTTATLPLTTTTPPESTTTTITTTATLPLTTTTLPESTTITTTATLPLTTTTIPPESTTTITTITALRTATTKTAAKARPITPDNNSGHASGQKSSKEILTTNTILALSLIMNVVGPGLMYLYMRRRTGPMMQQNGVDGALSQADMEFQSIANPANGAGNEEAFLMQQQSSGSQA